MEDVDWGILRDYYITAVLRKIEYNNYGVI